MFTKFNLLLFLRLFRSRRVIQLGVIRANGIRFGAVDGPARLGQTERRTIRIDDRYPAP